MRMRTVWMGVATGGIITALAGCPWDSSGEQTSNGGASPVSMRGGVAGAAVAASVEEAVSSATAARFSPAPTLDTLCKLRAGRTTYDEAKKLLPGKPQNESMDKMNASLSYRFSRPKQKAAGSDGGESSSIDDRSVSLYLSFKWSDGSPGAGTIIFGIGGSTQDFIRGYVLSEASINGMPYPSCWPHEEE